VGRVDGRLIINPTICDCEMLRHQHHRGGIQNRCRHGGRRQRNGQRGDMLDAIYFAHQAMQPIIAMQEELKAACGKEKRAFRAAGKGPELVDQVKSKAVAQIEAKPCPFRTKCADTAVREVKAELFANWAKTLRTESRGLRDHG
jgi:polyribonucleotide nucleotidyltransferase